MWQLLQIRFYNFLTASTGAFVINSLQNNDTFYNHIASHPHIITLSHVIPSHHHTHDHTLTSSPSQLSTLPPLTIPQETKPWRWSDWRARWPPTWTWPGRGCPICVCWWESMGVAHLVLRTSSSFLYPSLLPFSSPSFLPLSSSSHPPLHPSVSGGELRGNMGEKAPKAPKPTESLRLISVTPREPLKHKKVQKQIH